MYSSCGNNSADTEFRLRCRVKGLRQANGKCKGGANITWAKIMLVLNIIGFAGSIYDIIRGQMDIHYLCQELIYISIFYPYIKSAKNV